MVAMTPQGCDADGNPTPAPFAEALGAALKRRRITAVALRRRLEAAITHDGPGVAAYGRGLIEGWCNGSRLPSRATVVTIADALQCRDDERARLFAAAHYWPDEWTMP